MYNTLSQDSETEEIKQSTGSPDLVACWQHVEEIRKRTQFLTSPVGCRQLAHIGIKFWRKIKQVMAKLRADGVFNANHDFGGNMQTILN